MKWRFICLLLLSSCATAKADKLCFSVVSGKVYTWACSEFKPKPRLYPPTPPPLPGVPGSNQEASYHPTGR
jgi:hypothetical protein